MEFFDGYKAQRVSLVTVVPQYDAQHWEALSAVHGFPVLPDKNNFTTLFKFNGPIAMQQMLATAMNRAVQGWRVSIDMENIKYPTYCLPQLTNSVDHVALDQVRAAELWGNPVEMEPLAEASVPGWTVTLKNTAAYPRYVTVRDVLEELAAAGNAAPETNVWPVAGQCAQLFTIPPHETVVLSTRPPRAVSSEAGQMDMFVVGRVHRTSPETHTTQGGLNTFEYPACCWPLELQWRNNGYDGRTVLRNALSICIKRIRAVLHDTAYDYSVQGRRSVLRLKGVDYGGGELLAVYAAALFPDISDASCEVSDNIASLNIGLSHDYQEVLGVVVNAVLQDLEVLLAATDDPEYIATLAKAEVARLALLPAARRGASVALREDLIRDGDTAEIERLAQYVDFDQRGISSDVRRMIGAIGTGRWCCDSQCMTYEDPGCKLDGDMRRD